MTSQILEMYLFSVVVILFSDIFPHPMATSAPNSSPAGTEVLAAPGTSVSLKEDEAHLCAESLFHSTW